MLAATAITTYTALKKPSIDLSLLSKISNSASDTIIIDPCLEHIIPNSVTIYRKPKAADSLAQLLNEHQDLFQNQGQTVDIPEEEWMPIPLKPNTTSKPSKVYPVGQKDKEVIDTTFDKLYN